LQFSDFSLIFYGFSKFQQKPLLFEIWFYPKVRDTFFLLQIGPWFTNKALERLGALQYGPRGMVGGGSPEFRRSGDRDRPGTGEGRDARVAQGKEARASVRGGDGWRRQLHG
jgi:hypothetical protein